MVKKTFRDGNYYRHVRFGKRTVKDGECAAIWAYDGKRVVVNGPQRVRLFFAHVRFLDRHVASQSQYLDVQFRDGRKEHHRGPMALFMDPCVHLSITTKDAYKLSANEALVVYREQSQLNGTVAASAVSDTAAAAVNVDLKDVEVSAVGVPGSVERRIVRGPAVFIPAAEEWVHEFSWHGSISARTGQGSKTGSPGDEKVPHALKFSKLRCMPDQMYVTVKGVRTTDDAQVTIHLMVFYELKHIERMCDSTNDPIGDFINSASADVMTFGAANTYESLLQRTKELSDLATFPILGGRMQQVGFELLKIVNRGYTASETLQSMHDEAIAKRTKLKLEADTRAMEQTQAALELQCKQERSRAEMDLEEAERRHRIAMSDLDHTQALRHTAEDAQARLETQRALNEEEQRFCEGLKQLEVDLTQYLCVRDQKEPDHHIKVDGAAAPSLHLEVARKRE